jgi:hypothetical protein
MNNAVTGDVYLDATSFIFRNAPNSGATVLHITNDGQVITENNTLDDGTGKLIIANDQVLFGDTAVGSWSPAVSFHSGGNAAYLQKDDSGNLQFYSNGSGATTHMLTIGNQGSLDTQGVVNYGLTGAARGALSYAQNIVTLEATSANTDVKIAATGTGKVLTNNNTLDDGVGNFIAAKGITALMPDGQAPFGVVSQTMVPNLNVDMVGGARIGIIQSYKGILPSDANFDGYASIGMYHVSDTSSMVNGPAVSLQSAWSILTVESTSTGYVKQTLSSVSSKKIYYRFRTESVWTAWSESVDKDYIDQQVALARTYA